MQHSLLRLSFYFLCLFIVSDAAIKFPFHGHLRLRLGNVNTFPFLSTCT